MNFEEEYKQYVDFMKMKQAELMLYDTYDPSLNMSRRDFDRYKAGHMLTPAEHKEFMRSKQQMKKQVATALKKGLL